MIEITKTRLAVYLVFAALAGYALSGALAPSPEPRPAVRLFQKLFRWGAFLFLLGDEPPPASNAVHCHPHDQGDVHRLPIGSDGFPLVDHRRAF